jgi:glycerol uptake facilitator-like aquaporin
MRLMEAKRFLAELLGTFMLTFAVLLSSSAINFPIPIPFVAGLTLGLLVYSIGIVSGCHINPAVTLGFMSIKQIEPTRAAKYIIAQFLGAITALILITSLGANITGLTGYNTKYLIIGEVFGTAIFTFGIAAVVLGRVADGAKGFVIGASLTLGAIIAVLIGAPGFLNPAVALGAKSLNLLTLIGPIIGSLIGFQTYKYFIEDKNEKEVQIKPKVKKKKN